MQPQEDDFEPEQDDFEPEKMAVNPFAEERIKTATQQMQRKRPEQPQIQQQGEPESLGKTIARDTSSTVIGAAEKAAGWVGDIRNFLNFVAIRPVEAVLGESPTWRRMVMGPGGDLPPEQRKRVQKELGSFSPPSTNELHTELSQKFFKEYADPSSRIGKRIHDTTQDIVSLATPGTGNWGTYKNVGVPVLANIAAEGVKTAGGGEAAQDAVKTGFMFTLNLMHTADARRYAGGIVRAAENSVPAGHTMNVSQQLVPFFNLYDRLRLGGATASKSPVVQKVVEFFDKVRTNYEIPVSEVIEFRRNLNELKRDRGLFRTMEQSDREALGRNIDNLNTIFFDSLMDYGNARNPAFAQLYPQGQAAWSTYQQSNYISNIINSRWGEKLTSDAAKVLFGAGIGGISATGKAGIINLAKQALDPTLGMAAASSAALYKTTQVLYRVFADPNLRRHYQETIINALNGNAAEAGQNLKKLDDYLYKVEQDNKKREERIKKAKGR